MLILFKWAHPICVCGDDHVTCYIRADVDAGEQADAWDGVGDISGILILITMLHYEINCKNF